MTRSTLLVLALGAAISAAGYGIQHPSAKLKPFAALGRPMLKPLTALYTAPSANDVTRAIARQPEDQRRALTTVYQANGNRLLWTRARLGFVKEIAGDAAGQGLSVGPLVQARETLATGPHYPA